MAFEDCYPVTLDICSDCVQHIANGEGGCCHDPHHGDPRPYDVLRRIVVDRFAEWPCATGVRLERKWRGTDITLGCANDDCTSGCRSEEGTEPWFTHSSCEGCGSPLGGDREHATAWVRRDPRPVRTLTRNGWHVEIHPTTGSTFYAVAERDGDTRYLFHNMPHGGAERWLRVAHFVGTLPVAVALVEVKRLRELAQQFIEADSDYDAWRCGTYLNTVLDGLIKD